MTQIERREKDVPETLAFSALILEVLIEEEQGHSAALRMQEEQDVLAQFPGWSWTCRISSRL